jgi:hypothetical protein
MRVIGEIPHSEVKITVFGWNEKYLIKFETPWAEQTFKVKEIDLTSEQDVYEMVNEAFIQKTLARFEGMHRDLSEATSLL